MRYLLVLCCLAMAVAAGCQTESKPTAEISPGAVGVCTSCGQIKGTDVCCREDAVICGCGLAKGSPGCCKIEKGSTEPVSLCTSCGQFKGTDTCCQAGQPDCPKCGLDKGAPGCCKIDKLDA